MGNYQNEDLRVDFDRLLKLKFLGSQVTTDVGLLAYRELDEALDLTAMSAAVLTDSRRGEQQAAQLLPLLRQSIYSRLAGYEEGMRSARVEGGKTAVSVSNSVVETRGSESGRRTR